MKNVASLNDEVIFHPEPEKSPLDISAVMMRLIDNVSSTLGASPDDAAALERLPALLDDCLTQSELLTAQQRAFDSKSYARHLVHVDPAGRFSVLVVAWLAGQITPVHGHNAWGVVGVHAGVMENVSYAVTAGDRGQNPYTATDTHRAQAGHIAKVSAGDASAHQLRNPGPEPAFTVHIYGMDLTIESTGVNRYYD